MLTIIIGIVAIVVISAAIDDGQWGVVALTAAILVILIFAASEERKTEKAIWNMRDYWAEGGPRRGRQRRDVERRG